MSASRNPEELKALVREGYGEVARAGSSCCGPKSADAGVCGLNFSASYAGIEGYVPEADLGLGCGLPTESAFIRPGETVLDLGSGAGNDAFVAARLVGPQGRVIGLDMTEDMVLRARDNAARLGLANVEFVHGEIEAMPVTDAAIDLIVSNCVLNLVPNKAAAFAEMYRVLRPGGRFSISDVVLRGNLPPALVRAGELYVGCVAGALPEQDYLAGLQAAGFQDVAVEQAREIALPEAVVQEVLGTDGALEFAGNGARIVSVTVTGRR